MGYKSWLYIKYEQGLNLPYYHKFMHSITLSTAVIQFFLLSQLKKAII